MNKVSSKRRIKPFGTYTGFAMLSLHGARSMKLADTEGKDRVHHDTVFNGKED